MTSHNVCPSCRGEFHPHLSEHYYVVDLGWVTQNKNKNKERVLMVLTHSLFFLDDNCLKKYLEDKPGRYRPDLDDKLLKQNTWTINLDDIFLTRKISSRKCMK